MGSRKDYAQKRGTKRAASPKKAAAPKTQTQRKKPAPAPKKSTWKTLVFSFLGLAALVFLLNHLLGVKDTTPEVAEQSERKTVPAPKKPTNTKQESQAKEANKTASARKPAQTEAGKPVKEPKKEVVNTDPQPNKFEFYELLPKSEVTPEKVEAYKSTPRDAKLDKKYVLQAGSFRSEADAEKMRATLLLAGLPNVHTNKSDGSNGVWYRVRVGPFDNRPKLNKAQDKLARMRISAMKVRVE